MVAFIILKIHLTFVTCILYNFNYTFIQYVYNLYTYNIYKLQFEHVFIGIIYFKITVLYTSKFKKKILQYTSKNPVNISANLRSKIKKHQYQFLLHVFTLYKNKRCSMFNNINLMNHQFMFNGRQDFEKKFLI